MSGESTPTVHLSGADARRLIVAVNHLAGFDMALIGGFAVMARIGMAHRTTNDLDGVFDNPAATPTVVQLVAAGVGQPSTTRPEQSVDVEGTVVDVIDSTPLPDDPAGLPDEPKDRLFVCAHRLGYETATPIRLLAGSNEATLRVATPAALVAMKSHSLRYAGPQRRLTKRSSDLFDLYQLLTTTGPGPIAAALADTLWALDGQVQAALTYDVADHIEKAAANLRASTVATIAAVNSDDFVEAITDLLDRLPE